MDDPTENFSDLEAELKTLRPAPASPDLLARLQREFAVERASRAWWRWAALPAAAAAAVALGNYVGGPRLPARAARGLAATKAFQPVAAENVLYAARDEGLVTLEDGTLARRVRANYVDTITWRDPRGHASLRWSVPREDVRVMPINFQ